MKRKKERRSRIRTPLDFPTASGRKSRASGDRAARRRNDRENNLRSREGEKEGSAGVRSLFFFLSPFSERATPARPTKNGCVCGLRRLCRLVSAETGFLLIASALICPAAIASRLPLPKSVFPFLPPALLSCRDCFFQFRADCLHSCIVSAEKRFYLSFKQPAPAAKAAGAGCLRSISAKIRRKTDRFPCRGASFVCAAWGGTRFLRPRFRSDRMLERRRTLFHAARDFGRARLCPHFVQTEGARLPFALPARRLNIPQSPPALFARARRFVACRVRKERVREKCVGRGRGVQNKAERGRKSAPLRFVCGKKVHSARFLHFARTIAASSAAQTSTPAPTKTRMHTERVARVGK